MDELKYERIDDDLYFIASALKEIEKDYVVYRRRKTGKYEVHHLSQKGSSYALSVPYDELDFRTVTLVKNTRRERLDALKKEIEEENRNREKERLFQMRKEAECSSEAALKKE